MTGLSESPKALLERKTHELILAKQACVSKVKKNINGTMFQLRQGGRSDTAGHGGGKGAGGESGDKQQSKTRSV